MMNEQENPLLVDPDINRLDKLAKLLDNQFGVPGTRFQFGLDGIVGLVPYLGDVAGFAVSGILIRTMLKKGASPWMMLKMMGNTLLDTIIGIVPVLGDLFDFGYKANRRNVDMLKQYYADGHTKPNAKRSVAILGFLFLCLFALTIWAVWKIAAFVLVWAWNMLNQAF
jgi:hypothetical protein